MILLTTVGNVSAQSWITGMTFDYSLDQQSWDSTKQHNIVLDFPSLSYDETFEIKLNNVSSFSAYGGFKNHFIIKKNVIVADFSLGLNMYNYLFDITKKANSGPLDTTKFSGLKSDSSVWQNYLINKEAVSINGVYPSFRLHLGYKREVLNFRNLAIYTDAGMMIQRRFSFFQDFNKSIFEDQDTISAYFGSALNHRMIIPSTYIGLTFRMGSNSLGIRLGSHLGPITRKVASLQIKESYAQVTYTKLFKETHLGREQVIYDEYQHLSQTRASEYRRGDKFSYLQFGFVHDEQATYANETEASFWIIENADSILVNTDGYNLQPNAGFDIMLNTFFTHRWMMGLGLSMYEERYTSYGRITQADVSTPFGGEVLRTAPDNSYQEHWSKTKAAISLNTALYVSKRTMKIDPFVRGTASMVMDYDIPQFLKDNDGWRTTSFFPIFKIGGGFDIRLRLKSSKFFVIGAGADYNLNPHVNYLQYFVRVGYYRKKKLKNQTY